MRDPYKALGVDSNAKEADIKKAYRRLAKQYHPDRTGGDKVKEKRFKEISVAYDILSDSEKRARFDNMANGGGGIPAGDLSEIFAQMFGGGRAAPRGQRGSFSSGGGSPFGGMGGSPFGGGMGGSPFGGMGGSPFGGQPRPQARPKPAKKSPPKERKVKASDGSELTRRGYNIYSDLRIPFHEAMVGIVGMVPTLSGVAKVRVPPGTSSGQKLRLKDKGAKKPTTSTKSDYGDHFVTIHIDVPKVDGGKSGDLLAKLVKSIARNKS